MEIRLKGFLRGFRKVHGVLKIGAFQNGGFPDRGPCGGIGCDVLIEFHRLRVFSGRTQDPCCFQFDLRGGVGPFEKFERFQGKLGRFCRFAGPVQKFDQILNGVVCVALVVRLGECRAIGLQRHFKAAGFCRLISDGGEYRVKNRCPGCRQMTQRILPRGGEVGEPFLYVYLLSEGGKLRGPPPRWSPADSAAPPGRGAVPVRPPDRESGVQTRFWPAAF